MPYCSDCGRYSDSQALYCKNCGGMMQNAPPKPRPGAPPPPGAVPPPPPPPGQYQQSGQYQQYGQYSQPASEWGTRQYGPEPYLDSEQEAFLSQFSMGSGCWVYYLSNALILYFLIALGASLFTAGIGALAVYVWVGTFARRRRWEQLSWRDFEQFRREERQWELVGALAYVSGVITVILGIIGMLSGSQ